MKDNDVLDFFGESGNADIKKSIEEYKKAGYEIDLEYIALELKNIEILKLIETAKDIMANTVPIEEMADKYFKEKFGKKPMKKTEKEFEFFTIVFSDTTIEYMCEKDCLYKCKVLNKGEEKYPKFLDLGAATNTLLGSFEDKYPDFDSSLLVKHDKYKNHTISTLSFSYNIVKALIPWDKYDDDDFDKGAEAIYNEIKNKNDLPSK